MFFRLSVRSLVQSLALASAVALPGCSFGSDAVFPALTGMEDLRHPPVGAAPQAAPEPVIPKGPALPADIQNLGDKLASISSDVQRIETGWDMASRAVATQQAAYEKARANIAGTPKSAPQRNVAQAELSRLSAEINRAQGVASEAGGPATALAQLIAALDPMQEPDARALARKAHDLLVDFGVFIERMARGNQGYDHYFAAESKSLETVQ